MITSTLRTASDISDKNSLQIFPGEDLKKFGKDSQLYQTVKNAYDKEGFIEGIYKHRQGGVSGYRTGYRMAHSANNKIVRLNQAFAWNPTITGTKSEEIVLIKKGGIEILTASPDLPFIALEVYKNRFPYAEFCRFSKKTFRLKHNTLRG